MHWTATPVIVGLNPTSCSITCRLGEVGLTHYPFTVGYRSSNLLADTILGCNALRYNPLKNEVFYAKSTMLEIKLLGTFPVVR